MAFRVVFSSARRGVPYSLSGLLAHPPRRAISMKGSNKLKNAFDESKGPSMGLWQMLPGANISRVLARNNIDWVMVDCEHGNIDGTSLSQLADRAA